MRQVIHNTKFLLVEPQAEGQVRVPEHLILEMMMMMKEDLELESDLFSSFHVSL